MKALKMLLLVALVATIGCGKDSSTPVAPQAPKQVAGPSGRRTQVLTTPGQKLNNYQPDAEHPKVYGVLVDWHDGPGEVYSVVAMMDGTGCVYHTMGKDWVGSPDNPLVNEPAKALALQAGQLYDASKPIKTYNYPPVGQVNVYVLAFDGMRLLTTTEEALKKGDDPANPVFASAHGLFDVLHQLDVQKHAPAVAPGSVAALPGSLAVPGTVAAVPGTVAVPAVPAPAAP